MVTLIYDGGCPPFQGAMRWGGGGALPGRFGFFPRPPPAGPVGGPPPPRHFVRLLGVEISEGTMTYNSFDYQVRDGIGTVTFARPATLNSLTFEVYGEL